MAYSRDQANGRRYPVWTSLAGRFGDTRACFAAYLCLEAAEVIEGVKPGNLVNLVNRTRSCGLNPYRIWKEQGGELLAGSGLRGRELKDSGEALLVYLYREDLLQELLRLRGVSVILAKMGYREPGNLQGSLTELGERFEHQPCPHEVGIFLGYPLKDVLAFMGRIRLDFACQGPWKIFGDPRSSLELAALFRECRCRMAERLCSCSDPAGCLMAHVPEAAPPPYDRGHDFLKVQGRRGCVVRSGGRRADQRAKSPQAGEQKPDAGEEGQQEQ